jgi:Na+-transporting methylmalonyl-CoA/oxaloacetate decarboxylase gamma subunit
VIWTVLVDLLLVSFGLSVVFMFGSLLAYALEVVHEYIILPWKTRDARALEATLRRIPRRDMRHLPH